MDFTGGVSGALSMRRIATVFRLARAALVLLGAWVLPSGATAGFHYRVQASADLSRLHVEACFGGVSPRRLVSYDAQAIRYLGQVVAQAGHHARALRAARRTIPLPELQPDECVRYSVAIDRDATHGWFKTRQSTRHQVLLPIHRWLWFPEPFDAHTQSIDITFSLPHGMAVSTPWRWLGRNGDVVRYRYRARPPDWGGRVAIGRFDTFTHDIGTSHIRIAILNGKSPVDTEAIHEWLVRNLEALTLAYGEFPVPRLQVLVVPVGGDREPVPWGQVVRGGGDAVHLYIDQTQPLSEFLDDWVLIHELSHLLHPLLGGEDHWLSEGLASYYQNLLRARAGLLPAAQAWEKLHAGFRRGQRGTPRDRTLAQVSEAMSRNHLYMRVYWSGAAISLLADHALRERGDGQSLDRALAGLRRCCLPTRRQWSARELMDKLDAITGTDIFSRLYQRHVPSTVFPDLTYVYHDLGLIGVGNRLRFNPAAPAVDMRRAIMSAGRYPVRRKRPARCVQAAGRALSAAGGRAAATADSGHRATFPAPWRAGCYNRVYPRSGRVIPAR